MSSTRTIRCVCCGLDQDVAAGPYERAGVLTCPRCRAHASDHLDAYAVREAEHALMYRHALVDSEDDTLLARSERDFYLDKMRDAYAGREVLVEVLSKIDAVHHVRGSKCSCGSSGCKVVDLLADPRVARMIRSYDEERRTLRELRNANPELWTDTWDYIDVTLVYPKRDRRTGRGRHRATG